MVFVISLPKVEFLLGRRPIFKDGSVAAVIDVDNDQESEVEAGLHCRNLCKYFDTNSYA